MIDAIEIIINNGVRNNISAFIIPKDNLSIINEKKYSITDKQIDEIKDIIFTWNHEYGYSNKIDIEEFNVTIHSQKEKTTYHGKGIYPDNYDYFKEILGEVYGR